MRELQGRGDLCCINTATLGYREPLAVTAQRVARAGFQWITPWRQEVDEDHPERAAASIRAAGLKVAGYCRTAYFTAEDVAGRRQAIESNRKALMATAVLGAPMLIAVVGGLAPGQTDVEQAREQIIEGLAALLPTLRELDLCIALEPLHPYYAVDRSLLNTIDQAMQWCERLDPDGEGRYGIAVDAYHVWWDPRLHEAIARARRRIVALHVCDWLRDTGDPLLDRGMMGDGVIDLKRLRASVEATGFQGPVEVEIFSKNDWWCRDPDAVLTTCRERLFAVC